MLLMNSRRRDDRDKSGNRRNQRRRSRPNTNSGGSTDSSPTSTSVDRRFRSRTRSSTSELWNTFEPSPMMRNYQPLPYAGPFTGHFIHPEHHSHFHHGHHRSDAQRDHFCNHCIMGFAGPTISGPIAGREVYDRVGHLKPAHHHPYMADDALLYAELIPHNAGFNRADSYHSDYRGYFEKNRARSFESLPDMRFAERMFSQPRMPYPKYPHPNPHPMSWGIPQHYRPHHPEVNPLIHPRAPVGAHYHPHVYPQQHYPQYMPMADYEQERTMLYSLPHSYNFPVPPHHNHGHRHYRERDPLDFHAEARHHSRKKRSPSPERDERKRKHRTNSPKHHKKEEVKVETIPVVENEKRKLPLKLQKQLTQKSNFIHRENTNLSNFASPLFNGPPPRRVYAYADPEMHGLTPHPTTYNHPEDNYGQPSWLRYDSFGESPERRPSKRPSFDFDCTELDRQEPCAGNQMKKQKSPFNEVADVASRDRSASKSQK